MCREEAKIAFSRIADMKAAGATRIVCLVKEDVGTEVADFQAEFWPGEVLLDVDQSFYAALGGGKPWQPYSLAAFLAMVANPFSRSRSKANMARSKRSGIKNNMTGEGFVAGGCYVLRADGVPTYSFLEKEIGDHAPLDDVISSVREAVAQGVQTEIQTANPTTQSMM